MWPAKVAAPADTSAFVWTIQGWTIDPEDSRHNGKIMGIADTLLHFPG